MLLMFLLRKKNYENCCVSCLLATRREERQMRIEKIKECIYMCNNNKTNNTRKLKQNLRNENSKTNTNI